MGKTKWEMMTISQGYSYFLSACMMDIGYSKNVGVGERGVGAERGGGVTERNVEPQKV